MMPYEEYSQWESRENMYSFGLKSTNSWNSYQCILFSYKHFVGLVKDLGCLNSAF